VKLDGSLLNLRFGEPLPRVLLYHKPDGEIVTRDDPRSAPPSSRSCRR
jgi:23S rRNA pseudouridine2605 synthase